MRLVLEAIDRGRIDLSSGRDSGRSFDSGRAGIVEYAALHGRWRRGKGAVLPVRSNRYGGGSLR